MSERETQSVIRQFEESTRTAFEFLVEEFGCTGPEVGHPDALSRDVQYWNETTGVQVSLELREEQIFVYLVRLTPNGQFPPYFRHADQWLYMDALLRLSGAELSRPKVLGATTIVSLVRNYARALRQHGRAILRGDFLTFAQAKRAASGSSHTETHSQT
jgi:hypothetical protein